MQFPPRCAHSLLNQMPGGRKSVKCIACKEERRIYNLGHPCSRCIQTSQVCSYSTTVESYAETVKDYRSVKEELASNDIVPIEDLPLHGPLDLVLRGNRKVLVPANGDERNAEGNIIGRRMHSGKELRMKMCSIKMCADPTHGVDVVAEEIIEKGQIITGYCGDYIEACDAPKYGAAEASHVEGTGIRNPKIDKRRRGQFTWWWFLLHHFLGAMVNDRRGSGKKANVKYVKLFSDIGFLPPYSGASVQTVKIFLESTDHIMIGDPLLVSYGKEYASWVHVTGSEQRMMFHSLRMLPEKMRDFHDAVFKSIIS